MLLQAVPDACCVMLCDGSGAFAWFHSVPIRYDSQSIDQLNLDSEVQIRQAQKRAHSGAFWAKNNAPVSWR